MPSDLVEVDGIKIEQEDKFIFYFINQLKSLQVSLMIVDVGWLRITLMILESRIYPVGRLDYDTSGVLLLTNDGEFTNLMTHPRYHIKKKYVAKLKGYLMREEIKQLEKE